MTILSQINTPSRSSITLCHPREKALISVPASVPLEFAYFNLYQVDVVLPGLREAVLEIGVIVSVHLIAFQMDLEWCSFLHSPVPYVVEPLVTNQFNSRSPEIRVEFKHRLQELNCGCWSRFEALSQSLSFQLSLHLVGVDVSALICKIGQVFRISLP